MQNNIKNKKSKENISKTNTSKKYKSNNEAISEKNNSSYPFKFSYKSSFFICFIMILSNFFVPMLLSNLISIKLSTVLANGIMIAWAVCYSQYYIETDKGFNKSMIKIYLGLAVSISAITYFWLYHNLYI